MPDQRDDSDFRISPCCFPPSQQRRRPDSTLTRLNGWPVNSPAAASPLSPRMTTHGSRPIWFATLHRVRLLPTTPCRPPGALRIKFRVTILYMSFSRRDILQAGALSGAELIFGKSLSIIEAESTKFPPISTAQTCEWPRNPDIRLNFNFNQGWRFFRPASPAEDKPIHVPTQPRPQEEDIVNLPGSLWEQVNLPHTVRLEPLNASGGRNYQGVCWYTKQFPVKAEWRERTIHLVFQGAMQVTDVWMNGVHLSTYYGGYLPFTINISRAIRFGEQNVLTLRLDNSDNPEVPPGKPQNELDFVYFGGLYRSVQLQVMNRLHISDPYLANKVAGGGIFVTFPRVEADIATVQVQTDILNENGSRSHSVVKQELFCLGCELVGTVSSPVEMAAHSDQTVTQHIEVRQPKLWHPDRPQLYVLHTTINENGKLVDDQYTRIGIRKFHFDKENGLTINGKKFFSSGANRHQDHPYVGYALPASAHFKDAKKLRDAGFNSYRSHYPQDPAFMDACDELGMLAIVSNPGWQFVGNDVFKQRAYQNAREMIRRDRNHPSVILWEASLNETYSRKLATTLYRIVHEEYPCKGCYAAGNHFIKPVRGFDGWDVEYSYNDGTKPRWLREWGDKVDNWTDQQGPSRVARGWGEVAMLEQASWHLQNLNHNYSDLSGQLTPGNARLSGADLWAGIDYYRGYNYQPFYGGPLGLFRLPTFDYFLFRSQQPIGLNIPDVESEPMIFIANFATFESPKTVVVFSNCEEVRLYQNGKKLAVQKPDPGYHIPHPPFTFDVEQFSETHSMLFSTGVARPGTKIGDIKVEGLIGGKVVASHERLTPGVPTHIQLKVDYCGRDLVADGADWIRVYAHICDARGMTYPYADDLVTFTVNGEGSLIEDARIRANPVRADAGIAPALIRATKLPGRIVVQASAFGLQSSKVKIYSKQLSMPTWP
jgi:beta-galactosidase